MLIPDSFLERTVIALKNHNEYQAQHNWNKCDISFMLAILIQKIEDIYKIIKYDLHDYTYEIIVEDHIYGNDKYQDWDMPNLRIIFFDEEANKHLSHSYVLGFQYDDRFYSFCQCKPKDEGYNPLHYCCGRNCDWVAPQVTIIYENVEKIMHWEGDQADFWELETEIENSEIGNKYKQGKKKQLEEIISELQILESAVAEKKKQILFLESEMI